MVFLNMKSTCKEIPIADIISTGHIPFFNDLSVNCAEFRGEKNIERFRLIYNGKVLKEDDLKKITDNDAIRVILLPESKVKKSIDDSQQKAVDSELKMLANPFKNPEDRRLHGFNHDFNLPEHITNILKKHPQLVFDSHFLCVLKDWYLFRGYCIHNNMNKDAYRGLFKYTNPDFIKVFKDLVTTIGDRYGFNMGEQRGFDQRQAAVAPAVTQAHLQNALQAVFGGNMNPAARAPVPAARAPAPAIRPQPAAPAPVAAQAEPQQPAEEPMQQGYEQQAAILREYGFEDAELIQLALETKNGDIQEAMEFLLELLS